MERLKLLERVARTNKICVECASVIVAGQKYIDVEIRTKNRTFFHKAMCLDCNTIKNTYFLPYQVGKMFETMRDYETDRENGENAEEV